MANLSLLNQRTHDELIGELVAYAAGTPIVPHVSWRNRTPENVAARLQAYNAARITRILLDPPRRKLTPRQRRDGPDCDVFSAKSLIGLARENGDFTIGLRVYPDSASLPLPPVSRTVYLSRTAEELQAADFAVTAPLLSLTAYEPFMRSMRRQGIDKPIIPGITSPADRNTESMEAMTLLGGRLLVRNVGLHIYSEDNCAATLQLVTNIDSKKS